MLRLAGHLLIFTVVIAVTIRYVEVMLLCAILGAWLARKLKPRQVQTNEAMALVAWMFVFTSLLMT